MRIVALGLVMGTAFFSQARERSPGEKLTARRCSSCHVAIKPGKYSEQELRDAVEKHAKKLRSLSDEEKRIIIDYLKKK